MIPQRALSWLSALLLTTGVVQGVRGGWIHAKAGLAQVLLHRSWERTRAGGVEEKPWPWADTWPVARLTATSHDVDLIVVGSHGRHGFALLLGSTSTGVLHGAKCDVLAVRIRE